MKNLFHKSTSIASSLTEEPVIEELSEQDLEQVTGGYSQGWEREHNQQYWLRWYRRHHRYYGHDRDDHRGWYR